jgi:TPR repeat protein
LFYHSDKLDDVLWPKGLKFVMERKTNLTNNLFVRLVFLLSLFFITHSVAKDVAVKGYYRSNGVYVKPHFRSSPDATINNNWTTKGNVNPHTGKAGTIERKPTQTNVYRTNSYPNNKFVQLNSVSQFNGEAEFIRGIRSHTYKNYKEAAEWYEKSAALGQVDAQFAVAKMYEMGDEITQDYSKALKFYGKAAIQGHALAQNALGLMYYLGKGGAVDYGKSFIWFEKSALQNFGVAEFNLAQMYTNGLGTTRNIEKAFDWYKSSAEKNYPIAQYHLAKRYFEGPEKKRWLKKSSEQGYSKASLYLAYMYEENYLDDNPLGEVPSDAYKKSFFWYQKSAIQGNSDAQYLLGLIYEEAEGVEQNFEMAKYWFIKASEQGNDNAKKALNKY